MSAPRSVWTTDITDPVVTVLAVGLGVLLGVAIGMGKLPLTAYALLAPLPFALASAVALSRSVARAVLAGFFGSATALCISVPLGLIRAWGSMF